MIQFTCDRCGNSYKPFVSEHGNNGFQFFKQVVFPKKGERPLSFWGTKNLCPQCMEELESWFYEEKWSSDDEDVEIEENVSAEQTPFNPVITSEENTYESSGEEVEDT